MKRKLNVLLVLALVLAVAVCAVACDGETPANTYTISGLDGNVSLKVGETKQLSASVAGAENVTFTYSSSATGIITVNDGVITAIAEGTATVTVTAKSGETTLATATVAVTVTAADVQPTYTVTATPASATLKVGQTQSITAAITGAAADDEIEITYASSAADKASVDAVGKVTALAAGSANITVTGKVNGETVGTATVAITVEANALTATPASADLKVGQTQSVNASLATAITGATYTYASSAESVATVSDGGVITARAAGSANVTVTAKSGNVTIGTATVAVTVSNYAASATPATANIHVGATQNITASTEGLTDVTYTYASSAESVATVSDSGVITAVAAGTANITVSATKAGTVIDSATVAVTVNNTLAQYAEKVYYNSENGGILIVASGDNYVMYSADIITLSDVYTEDGEKVSGGQSVINNIAERSLSLIGSGERANYSIAQNVLTINMSSDTSITLTLSADGNTVSVQSGTITADFVKSDSIKRLSDYWIVTYETYLSDDATETKQQTWTIYLEKAAPTIISTWTGSLDIDTIISLTFRDDGKVEYSVNSGTAQELDYTYVSATGVATFTIDNAEWTFTLNSATRGKVQPGDGEEINVTTTSSVPLPAASIPTDTSVKVIEHYTFSGWYAAYGSPANLTDAEKQISSDRTIYGKYRRSELRLIFMNGEEEVQNSYVAVTGDRIYATNISTPATPTKSGYVFKGWEYTDPNGATTILDTSNSSNQFILKDTTFTAKWASAYVLTFIKDGTTVESRNVEGGNAGGPAPVVAEEEQSDGSVKSYVFKDADGNEYDPTATVSASAEYTAVATTFYYITFNVDGARYVRYRVASGESTGETPADPEKADNKFVGWYDAEDNEYSASATVSAAATYNAKFEEYKTTSAIRDAKGQYSVSDMGWTIIFDGNGNASFINGTEYKMYFYTVGNDGSIKFEMSSTDFYQLNAEGTSLLSRQRGDADQNYSVSVISSAEFDGLEGKYTQGNYVLIFDGAGHVVLTQNANRYENIGVSYTTGTDSDLGIYATFTVSNVTYTYYRNAGRLVNADGTMKVSGFEKAKITDAEEVIDVLAGTWVDKDDSTYTIIFDGKGTVTIGSNTYSYTLKTNDDGEVTGATIIIEQGDVNQFTLKSDGTASYYDQFEDGGKSHTLERDTGGGTATDVLKGTWVDSKDSTYTMIFDGKGNVTIGGSTFTYTLKTDSDGNVTGATIVDGYDTLQFTLKSDGTASYNDIDGKSHTMKKQSDEEEETDVLKGTWVDSKDSTYTMIFDGKGNVTIGGSTFTYTLKTDSDGTVTGATIVDGYDTLQFTLKSDGTASYNDIDGKSHTMEKSA